MPKEATKKPATKKPTKKPFEGQSITFYLNNVEIKCSVDYMQNTTHLEFHGVHGEPNVMTETGYRSHFCNVNLGQYSTMQEVVEGAVKAIMDEKKHPHGTRNKGNKTEEPKYTLSWEPSQEYLKHNPKQLSLF